MKWFGGFGNGLDCISPEARCTLLACCAKSCADTGILDAYRRLYDTVSGDRDEFYRRLSETGNVRAEIIVPRREYIICFPECGCDLHVSCGVNTPALCECSRQSILYVARSIWTGCTIEAEKLATVLSGADECRFRLTFHEE